MQPIYEVSLARPEDVSAAAGRIRMFGIDRISLTHKTAGTGGLELARLLREALPTVDVALHLSLRNLGACPLSEWLAVAAGCAPQELLVLSGNPRPKADLLSRWPELPQLGYRLACSHTCGETQRLSSKLALPGPQAVCLQITDDCEALRAACLAIRSARPDLEIRGCLLIPNPSIRARLRFRNWHGVQLSTKYLDDQLYAEYQTERLVGLYRELNVRPFVEAIPFNDLAVVASLNYLKPAVGR